MSNEAKVEMVPMLQDMRTYITNHYWSEILCEVEEQDSKHRCHRGHKAHSCFSITRNRKS